jgi:cytochrome bd-type quinol oxidase subunit 2
MEPMIYTAIGSMVALAALWILLFVLFRNLELDWFRHSMFRLREELFDYAASGDIGFDSAVYGILRTRMNGFLRFGHKMTLAQLIVLMVLMHPDEEQIAERAREWERACATLDAPTREAMITHSTKIDELVLRHIFFGSPELTATIVIPLVLILMCLIAGKVLVRLQRRTLKRFGTQVMDINALADMYGSPAVA